MKNIFIIFLFMNLFDIQSSFAIQENVKENYVPIKKPECNALKKFPIQHGGLIETNNIDEIINPLFGKELLYWQEEDYTLFFNIFIECRNNNEIFLKWDKEAFPRQVLEVIKALKREQEKRKIDLESDHEANLLQEKVDILIYKIKNFTITNEEIKELIIYKEQAAELHKKYDNNNKFSNINSLIDEEFENYKIKQNEKENKDKEEKIENEQRRIKEENKKAYNEKVKNLFFKYRKLGPPENFLAAHFQTYSGAAVSGDLGAVIDFFDKLPGEKRWKKKKNIWILYQDVVDPMTDEKIKCMYGFKDERDTLGYIFLERIVVNNNMDIPSSAILPLILKFTHSN